MNIKNMVPRIAATLGVMAALFALPAVAQVAKIGPGDAVKLTVRGVPDSQAQMLGGTYKVDQNGMMVGLPFLEGGGGIQAAGLTEGQLSQNIAAAYKQADIYTRATFTAIVDQPPVARQITVGGEVVKPGQQAYFANMTLFDAYTAASGAGRFGSRKRVFLIRDGEPKRTYNMDKDEDKIVRLLPNDTIVIDKKGWAEP